jgi:hypothetical protein
MTRVGRSEASNPYCIEAGRKMESRARMPLPGGIQALVSGAMSIAYGRVISSAMQ